jgi:hypothetical protein
LKAPVPYAPSPESHTHTLSHRFHRAGKAAAIEERMKGMGFDEAQAARIKAAKDARNRGA